MRDDAALTRLIGAVADRDEAALRALYHLVAPKLFGIVLRIQRDRGLAEDVLQDVFVRIWGAASSYSPEAGPPLSWLCTIARNRAIDSVRRKGEIQGPTFDDGEDWVQRLADPRDSESAILGREALNLCLGRLDRVQAECVVLAYCEGFSREELAERYERPVNTIKTWLHRALGSLKGCLESVS